jgi:preprotein translocase subunit SecD
MRNKKVNITIIVIFIIIVGVSFYYIFKDSISNSINLGLDLKGGLQIILRPIQSGEDEEIPESKLEKTIGKIRDRIDLLGVSEPLVTKDKSNNIVIQLPGVEDPDTAKEIIGKTAELEFRLVMGTFISVSEQKWDFIGFDYEKGQLLIDPDSEQVLLIDDINAMIAGETFSIVGELITEPDTNNMLLVEFGDEENQEEDDQENEQEASQEADTGIDTSKIIGKIIYNQETKELRLIDYRQGDVKGEVLVDARTGAVTLVEQVLLRGEDLARAVAGYDSYGSIRVLLSFKDEGVEKFAEVTSENIGRNLAIVLDERIESAPYIKVPIEDGEAEITGINSIEEAKNIEIVLQTGALPITLHEEESSYIGPTLGRDSLSKGLYAGIIGLILIIAFMVSYYRGLGFVSTISLMIYIILFWGIIAGLGAALTLPGIAGIILTIGMAVDANVIIFERIKEEILKEKSPRIAVGDGFKNALRTIIDSNVTTLITAAALYWFGTGPIRGFAVTLSLGVIISMLVSLLFTRSVLFLMAGVPRIATPGFMGVRRRRSE